MDALLFGLSQACGVGEEETHKTHKATAETVAESRARHHPHGPVDKLPRQGEPGSFVRGADSKTEPRPGEAEARRR